MGWGVELGGKQQLRYGHTDEDFDAAIGVERMQPLLSA